ncbi:MAG: hypothetical protein PHU07_02470 [Acidocella sp.]|nr:hypothetical protein [Acidocella sp.]
MASIVFYEKPGCTTNTRQKQLLADAGHTVISRSLLTEAWTAARLQAFFDDMPVSSWFNQAAPTVKSGAVNPMAVDAATALGLMLADPLLIRRPLLEIGEQRCAGFEPAQLSARLGLQLNADGRITPEGCSHSTRLTPCPPPHSKDREA